MKALLKPSQKKYNKMYKKKLSYIPFVLTLRNKSELGLLNQLKMKYKRGRKL